MLNVPLLSFSGRYSCRSTECRATSYRFAVVQFAFGAPSLSTEATKSDQIYLSRQLTLGCPPLTLGLPQLAVVVEPLPYSISRSTAGWGENPTASCLTERQHPVRVKLSPAGPNKPISSRTQQQSEHSVRVRHGAPLGLGERPREMRLWLARRYFPAKPADWPLRLRRPLRVATARSPGSHPRLIVKSRKRVKGAVALDPGSR